MKNFLLAVLLFVSSGVFSQDQLRWQNVDEKFGPLPKSVRVYFTNQPLDTSPFRAYYLIADLQDHDLEFTTDTTTGRRLTPWQFYERNNRPLAVVNGTFFSFATNQNLNLVIREGKLISYNVHSLPGRGKDTLTYRHPYPSAIGITKDRRADVAWVVTDTSHPHAYYLPRVAPAFRDSVADPDLGRMLAYAVDPVIAPDQIIWNMHTAIGGGPVLVQEGAVRITNNEELKFAGKAINDKHPRTAMGYTKDSRLILLVVEGRNPEAAGATLKQLAQLMKDLGCVEALNLDGGGSSCLLVNGKETIKPSDKNGQRAVPAVFIIRQK